MPDSGGGGPESAPIISSWTYEIQVQGDRITLIVRSSGEASARVDFSNGSTIKFGDWKIGARLKSGLTAEVAMLQLVKAVTLRWMDPLIRSQLGGQLDNVLAIMVSALNHGIPTSSPDDKDN